MTASTTPLMDRIRKAQGLPVNDPLSKDERAELDMLKHLFKSGYFSTQDRARYKALLAKAGELD